MEQIRPDSVHNDTIHTLTTKYTGANNQPYNLTSLNKELYSEKKDIEKQYKKIKSELELEKDRVAHQTTRIKELMSQKSNSEKYQRQIEDLQEQLRQS